jgi:hypothetical protein
LDYGVWELKEAEIQGAIGMDPSCARKLSFEASKQSRPFYRHRVRFDREFMAVGGTEKWNMPGREKSLAGKVV